jgi:hypothetical protein
LRPRGLRAAVVLFAGWAAASRTAGAVVEPAVSLYRGRSGVFDENRVGEAGIEWQLRPLVRNLRPIVGAVAGEDRSSFGYVGLRFDHSFGRLFLAPFTGAGYFRPGDGPNLGGHFQFRSGLEIGVTFGSDATGDWRIGVSLDHLSNGGLDRPNPGKEAIALKLTRAVRDGR